MDLRGLGPSGRSTRPIHPQEIFDKLPALPGTPNDLWRGQASAIAEWHTYRTDSDVLIALNTGAGKTLAGLLIAQSLVNEGLSNVLYVCATIDLVRQTKKEASKVGIQCTTRIGSDFSDDLFESGKSFCITTYHAVFNGHSALRRRHFPEAIIFDDAHVAETVLRDSFTLSIRKDRHSELLGRLIAIFDRHFREIGRPGFLQDVWRGGNATTMMATPGAVREHAAEVLHAMVASGIADDDSLKFSFAHLRDKIDRCAFVFGSEVCEITPYAIPTLTLDIFDRRVRRIYLSASLDFKTDVVRGFGRLPARIVEPDSDAGNGERLFVSLTGIRDSDTATLIGALARDTKVVVAVPSYSNAKGWQWLGRPPSREGFSEALDQFRVARTGSFILVNRVDGIDLPDEACRIMVIDGLPTGSSVLERFQWEMLNMRNFFAARIANRMVQLFGRINRGRKDFGVFLVRGREATAWLRNDRNLALLPTLPRQQLQLGWFLQERLDIHDTGKVREIIDKVLSRAEDWLDLYQDNVGKGTIESDTRSRATATESVLIQAAENEASFARDYWDGRYERARIALEAGIEDLSRTDDVLAGWHSILIAACYEAEGDHDSALANYERAQGRLGRNFSFARTKVEANDRPALAYFGAIAQLVSVGSPNNFDRQWRRWRSDMQYIDGGSSNQVEESVRALGELLGFDGSRPDNIFQTGPDVLWRDGALNLCMAIEVKSDKVPSGEYFKKEVAQLGDSIAWTETSYPSDRLVSASIAGPCNRVALDANPSDRMTHIQLTGLSELRDEIVALVNDARLLTPAKRYEFLKAREDGRVYSMEHLAARLASRSLISMKAPT